MKKIGLILIRICNAEPTSLVYSLHPAEISAEVLYFLYTAPEFSNLRATVVSLPPLYCS
jgi:hypothetical protein